MSTEWFVNRNGGPKAGPFSTTQLKELAANGTLQPTDFVWKEGQSEWVKAGQIKGLFPTTLPRSVPLPPITPVASTPRPRGGKTNKTSSWRRIIMAALLFIIGLPIFCLGGGWMLFYIAQSNRNQGPDEPTSIPPGATQVTAGELLAVYKNEFAGDKKYKDKEIYVTGEVIFHQHIRRLIGDGFLTLPEVWLSEKYDEKMDGPSELSEPSGLIPHIHCEFSSHDNMDYHEKINLAAAGDRKGVAITIRGVCYGKWGGNDVKLTKCSILTSLDEIKAKAKSRKDAHDIEETKRVKGLAQEVVNGPALTVTIDALIDWSSSGPSGLMQPRDLWQQVKENQVIETTGVVKNVNGRPISIELIGKAHDQTDILTCYFSLEHEQEVSKLRPGSEVSVRGRRSLGQEKNSYCTKIYYCILVKR